MSTRLFLAQLAGLVLWIMLPPCATAQTPPGDFVAGTWTSHEGLPSDSVTTVLRARDGYLWVGTANGVVRFDGVRFLRLSLPAPQDATAIPVTALCEDDAGQIWIGTSTLGLFRVTGSDIRPYGLTNGLADLNITCLAAGRGGDLWIGTKAGLHHLQHDRMTCLTVGDGLPNDSILSVNVARSGNVWITTREGVCRFRDGRITSSGVQDYLPGRSGEFVGAYEDNRGNLWAFGDSFLMDLTQSRRFNYFRAGDPVATRVWTLHESRDGSLWIGTSGRGLFRFKAGRFDSISLPDERLVRDVRAITSDDEDNVWLGTHDGGLVRLSPAQFRRLDLPTRFGGAARTMTEDANGRLWVGVDGDGLYLVREGRGEPADQPQLAEMGQILSACTGAYNALWFGTWGMGLYRTDRFGVIQFTVRNGLRDDIITAVCASQDANAFAGSRAGDVQFLQGREWINWGTSPLPRSITVLHHGRDSTLWAGTDGAGLWHITDRNAAPAGPAPALSNAVIRAMAEDDHGQIWVGTAAHGLACVTRTETRVATVADGLPANTILQVLFDRTGHLWLGTDRGIFRLEREAAAAFAGGEPFTPPFPVGMRQEDFELRCLPGSPGAIRTRSGYLWFSTADGVVGLDPNQATATNSPAPVYIEEVLVNGEPVRSAWAEAQSRVEFKTPQPLRSLEIHFTTPSLRAPESMRFRHKLEGFDEEWSAEGTSRLVRYGRLPPGDYRFRVMTAHAAGFWHEPGAEFHFTVPTPWWRAAWFLALAGLAALGSAALAARQFSNRRLRRRLNRLQQEQAMERERSRIARDMHDELGAKLTKVSFLSERLKSRAAGAPELGPQIDSIAGTTRSLLKSLDEIVWAVNPRNDTLGHLADYLAQYADEYFQNTPIECTVNLPDELPEIPLSAERRHNLFLAFEEALNNALKHSQASQVQVTMTCANGIFAIRIEDNGCGFASNGRGGTADARPPGHGRGGNGLANLKTRLNESGGTCDLDSAPERGTRVTLRLPLRGNNGTSL